MCYIYLYIRIKCLSFVLGGTKQFIFLGLVFCCCCCCHFFFSLRPHLQHMEVPRLGMEPELQLRAYTTATAMPDPSRVCHLHHSSQWHQILNPLSKARDQTCNLMVPSRICFCCTTTGTPAMSFLLLYSYILLSFVLKIIFYCNTLKFSCHADTHTHIYTCIYT